MPKINILDLVISLIITVAVYSLPIIVARYAILRRPVDRSKAKVITITYAVVGMIVMAVLVKALEGDDAKITFGGLILWSFVNYKMLISGKDRRKTSQTTGAPTTTVVQAKKMPILSFKAVDTSETTNEAVEAIPARTAKVTYCKKCGSPINGITKKCNGCGKQYFKISKRVFAVTLVAVIAVGLVGTNVYQYITNKQTVELLNENLESMRDNRDEFISKNDDLTMQLISKEKELGFWDEYAVICTTEGSKYHHYGCSHIEGKNFYIYNIDQAEALGYTPCLDCCGG